MKRSPTRLAATLLVLAPLLAAVSARPATAQSPELEADRWFNVAGELPTLEALRGRAVLIEFWATW